MIDALRNSAFLAVLALALGCGGTLDPELEESIEDTESTDSPDAGDTDSPDAGDTDFPDTGSTDTETGTETETGTDTETETGTDTSTDTTTNEAIVNPGEDCTNGGTCTDGHVCSGVDGTCQTSGSAGTVGEDGTCQAAYDCTYELVCSSGATCQEVGSEGTGTNDDDCQQESDCQLGLSCIDTKCSGVLPEFWTGVECAANASVTEPLKVYFEVTGTSGEFFRLPFPNDILLNEGKIDLSGLSRPEVSYPLIGDPLAEVFDMVENDSGGYSPVGSILFRFNRVIDIEALSQPAQGNPAANMWTENVLLVNIDPDSTDYGASMGRGYSLSTGKNAYVCQNWFGVSPYTGRPLEQGATYAVIIKNGIVDPEGNPAVQDDDFEAMLSSSRPEGDVLAAAWDKYAPLRNYLTDEGIAASTVAGAAVFTVGPQQGDIRQMREVVAQRDAPTVSGVTTENGSGYTLITGKLNVPFFQVGTLPFQTVSDGGAITYDGDGKPVFVEDQAVEFALTVPQGAAPASGWPIVLYAHGTGGSETSFVSNGVADELTKIGVAAIGLEQVMHGARRGLLPAVEALELPIYEPEVLFYNYLNPRAARDNNVQAAADTFQLVRFVENFKGITSQDVEFNPEKIYFYGHSQGTQGPFLAAVHEPKIKGIVLSGAGGHLVHSLIGKKQPVDVEALVRLMISENTTGLNRYHPMINLLQTALDSVDPVNFARTAFYEDGSSQGLANQSVFMSYGVGDGYVPKDAQTSLARAFYVGMKELPVDPESPIGSISLLESLPYTGSVHTSVVVQYEADGDYDPHFVMTRNADAISQWTSYLETMVSDGIPTLSAPK